MGFFFWLFRFCDFSSAEEFLCEGVEICWVLAMVVPVPVRNLIVIFFFLARRGIRIAFVESFWWSLRVVGL